MDKHTGRAIDGIDHIQQSIGDILTTRIGTRVERRAYGSDLPRLIDDPVDQRFRVEAYAAVAGAIRRWEPRVTAERVQLIAVNADGPVFELDIVRNADGLRARIRV
ncbi:GPW/gp25 family protein [Salinisphaera orenii]|uniref:Baseplate assembly protein n=1 Tax=Salinisphaera orenii YIM 95161 TaxID=1051139 RepID=A0A423PQJ1_9GAMM|nr:GPW/gp25 family protein [Salinisphaera halophila]ROO27875.1 baseplate assembly protein [Salinisphaera halophila YIM 95161]